MPATESKFWNPKIETLPKEQLHALQLVKLQGLVQRAWNTSPFHRRLYEKASVTPDQIKTLDDIQRLPFMTREDWMECQSEQPLFGDMLTRPEDEAIRYHLTSGTSGRQPLRVLDSRKDWSWIADMWCYGFWGFGIRPKDKVFFAFSYGSFIGFWGAHYCCEKMGTLTLASGNMNTEQRVKQIVEIPAQDERSQSLFRLLQKQLQELAGLQEHLDAGFATALLNVDDPAQLADFSAGIVRKIEDRQRLLAEADVGKRCELALQFAMVESELAALDQKIQDEIRQKAEKAQKDYFLREQLKIIRRELGEEQDPRTMELKRLEKAVVDAKLPEDAQRRATEELTRLQTTPVESGEYGVIRNYLDWLVSLPWSVTTRDHTDLARAARVLRDDHYGLDEVKERIIEFLAV
ncbi:MAG TPA: hypothetical protein EYP98_01150, partial [Planctomycetes bacterium]|nr:hypothetical protein [Planctomycetota bacterium]